jgi:hypothetical protein
VFRGLLKEAFNLSKTAKVGLHGDALSSEFCDFGYGIIRFGLRPVVMDYDVGAFCSQAHSYGAAEALGGAGHERYATLQCGVHPERNGSTGQPRLQRAGRNGCPTREC